MAIRSGGGTPICAFASAFNVRCIEAGAYLNRFIRIVEEFMEDVIRPIQPHPELVYIYTQLDYQPTEGPQQPVGEMILQVRMHLSYEISAQQAPGIVATILGKLGIAAPLYSVAWMVQGVRFEAMGRNARRSHPLHGIFYGKPGLFWPIPQGIIRDIPNTFYWPDLLDVLPVEVLQALAGYTLILGSTPGYVTWDRGTQNDTLVLYFLPTVDTTNPCIWLPTQTLVDLGRSAYAPARMELVEDVINMVRLRTRSIPTLPAPIQVYTISETDSTGTPLSGWSNSGWGGGRSVSGASLDSSGGGTLRGSRCAQTGPTPQCQTPRATGSTSHYDQSFPTFGGASSDGEDYMSSDPPYTPIDHTGRYSRGAQEDRHAASTSAHSERDELRAQLAQALHRSPNSSNKTLYCSVR
jgi:hypothetical protein